MRGRDLFDISRGDVAAAAVAADEEVRLPREGHDTGGRGGVRPADVRYRVVLSLCNLKVVGSTLGHPLPNT